jgi:hypothetical protein
MKQNVSPAVVAVAIIAALGIAVVLGFKTLGPASKPPPPKNAAYEEYRKTGHMPEMQKPGAGGAPSTAGTN